MYKCTKECKGKTIEELLSNYSSPLADVRVPGDDGALGVVPLARSAKDNQNTAEENQHRSDHPDQVQMNLSKEECGEEYDEKRVTDLQERGQRSVLLIDRQRIEEISAGTENQIEEDQTNH